MMLFLSVLEAAQCVLDSDRKTPLDDVAQHPRQRSNGGLGILFREESRLREGKIPVEPLGQGVSVACGEDELIERTHDYV